MKRLFLLSGIILAISFNLFAQPLTEVKRLRTEYLKNPMGIDVKTPRLSWELNNPARGAKQSAYEIIVSTDKTGANVVWDSGKIKSDKSVNNLYDGKALAPSTRYYWQVKVWDNKNKMNASTETAYFETGLLDSGWGDAKWIKATNIKQRENAGAVIPVTDYTLRMDFQINEVAAGPCFGVKDVNNFFMWQFDIETGKTRFRPHTWVNGNVTILASKDITSLISIKKGVTYALRIEVKGDKASTYINNILIDADRVNPGGGNYGPGNLGFRSAQAEKGNGMESATYDNILLASTIRNATDGVVKPVVTFSENFEKGENPFEGAEIVTIDGNAKLKVTSTGNELRAFQGTNNGVPMFRKKFNLDKDIQSAKLYSSALGVYDLFINGKRVGKTADDGTTTFDELKPGWTEYNKTVQYTTYDVTALLHSGENAVGAYVAPGWWNGAIARNAYGDKDISFIAKIIITYTDGSTKVIVTDPTWLSSTNGPVRMADIYMGETYDARKESDWNTAGFDDSQWNQTADFTGFTGTIKAFVGPSIQVRPGLTNYPVKTTIYQGTKSNGQTYGEINTGRVITGTGIVQLKAGETALYDFGQNMAGWVKFTANSAAGTKMKIRFGEMLNDNGALSRGNDGPAGSLYTANLRTAKATINYTFNGSEGGETFNPNMTFFGFRYCEVTANEDVELQSLSGIVVGSATEEGSSFKTSSAMVNKLYSNIMWGQRSNFLSVTTDCPQRDERLGWTGDTQIFSRAAAYNADVASFFHKWMGDMRDSQRGDGAFPSTAPIIWGGYGQGAWAEAGIIVPWNVYLMYDDAGIITENYAAMEKYMGFLAKQAGGGYLYNGAGTDFGDWVAYESMDSRYVSVCYYAYAAQLMSKMSKALSVTKGDAYDVKSETYKNLYTNIKAEFQKRYVTEMGTLKQVSQTAYLLALKLGLFPDDVARNNGITFLTQKIANNGDKLSTGFIGTGTLNQTLSQSGASNTAYNLLLQRGNPSWIYSIDQGATTIWERWNSYTIEKGFQDVSMNSFNHYSYGAVSEWMYRFVAGIETDEATPGFKHFILQPTPDTRTTLPKGQERITSAEATYHSYYGEIKSAWVMRSDGNLAYTATVPANTTATLYLPLKSEKDVVYEGTKPAKNSKGVKFVKIENGKAVYELQSGSYSFGIIQIYTD